jgi:molecular chaperone GrpE
MAKRKSTSKPKSSSADITAQLKRAIADYQNLLKRQTAEKTNYTKYANFVLLDKLLPILDDLQRAQQHLKDKGIGLILEQFLLLLSSEGVKPIKAFKQKFNPQTMDCIELVSGPKNQVIEVTQPGYFINDKVLRPAKVKVGKGD